MCRVPSRPYRYYTFQSACPRALATCRRVRSKHQLIAAGADGAETATTSAAAAITTKKIAIVGGGLAGLSTAFHLLRKLKSSSAVSITVMDTAPAGMGGASSVAGGLVHPLSPRGKLVHWGLEGLDATNRLIEVACHATHEHQESTNPIVLGNEIYRVALTQDHAMQLQHTAREVPHLAQWLDRASLCAAGVINVVDAEESTLSSSTDSVVGALRLSGQCQVIHVPAYLKGLWTACTLEAVESNPPIHLEWLIIDENKDPMDLRTRLRPYDTVVLSAGSGMFSSNDQNSTAAILADCNLPIQLVRGQSITVLVHDKDSAIVTNRALLCGKYVLPMPGHSNRVMVGATHEFQSLPLSRQQVIQELKDRTYPMAPWLWREDGTDHHIEQVIGGIRVQTTRGAYGRRPLIGRLLGSSGPTAGTGYGPPEPLLHPNAFIFTGLSSRGLLYHGLYGDILTDAIIQGNEDSMIARCPDILSWRS